MLPEQRGPGLYTRLARIKNEHDHISYVYQEMRKQPPVTHSDPEVGRFLESVTPGSTIPPDVPYNPDIAGYLWDAQYLQSADAEILGIMIDE